MRERWEYLFVYYRLYTNWDTKEESEAQTFTHQVRVSTATDTYFEQSTFEELFNKLGDNGWELTSETVLDTTMLDIRFGWTDVATPVKTRFIFKRAVQE